MLSHANISSQTGINTSGFNQSVGDAVETDHTAQEVAAVEEVNTQKQGTANQRTSSKPQRSLEDVQLVLDQNKGAIYALYQRALRKDPGLRGKVVLEITIAPDGTVDEVKIISSELEAPSLMKRLTRRVKLFKFGDKPVETLVVTYPIDFLPAS